MKGVGQKKAEVLVTSDERTAKLYDLLGSRFTNHGQLLIPTYSQYESLSNTDGLLAVAKEFCRWLGYKPRSLDVQYGVLPKNAYYQINASTISINRVYAGHPYVVGGILACAVLGFILEHHDYAADDLLIETSTIETGLGLWVINALQPKLKHLEKIYHIIDGNWEHLEGLQLQTMSVSEYIRDFTIFTSEHRHFPEDYGRGVSKRSLHLLPATPSTIQIIPLAQPSVTHTHKSKANALWTKIIILSLIVATISVFGLVIWDQRTRPTPYEETRDAQSLRVIKSSLSECIQTASKQESTYDPNDLFMTRQVDATKTRCESLRNQYNDALSTYETNYRK